MKFSKVRGFTILELVVTISIIGILSTIVLTNMAAASKRGRDVERQSDLRNLQNAVESYKKKNGTYPDMGPNPNGDNWSRLRFFARTPRANPAANVSEFSLVVATVRGQRTQCSLKKSPSSCLRARSSRLLETN